MENAREAELAKSEHSHLTARRADDGGRIMRSYSCTWQSDLPN